MPNTQSMGYACERFAQDLALRSRGDEIQRLEIAERRAAIQLFGFRSRNPSGGTVRLSE